MRSWFDRQIREIAADRVLRLYGVALACVNVLTFVHWQASGLSRTLAGNRTPICWPFWEDCHAWRVLTVESVSAILGIYLVLSVAAGACFLSKRHVRWGYFGLILVNALRVAIMVQDFTLRANQHYMASWAALAFLFFPHRRVLVPALLVSFYFWAGVLKLDMEWLSGAALYNRERLWIPDALVPASCVYVVVLEMVLIFGLYARRSWIFWATFGQLLLFHVYSWPIVGFYYPMLMFGLISIFALIRLSGPPMSLRSVAGTGGPAVILLGGFALTQFLPVAFPGNSAITGEGRLFALNMFDARVVCHASATLRTEDGRSRKVFLSNKSYAKRIACDPILFFNLAREKCRGSDRKARVVDLDLSLRSRRTTDGEFRDVIDLRNFCTSGVTYDMWRPNDWILK
ncbi:MAG: hypothetical protein ABR587_11775 [Candidatus Binatia bacterium]